MKIKNAETFKDKRNLRRIKIGPSKDIRAIVYAGSEKFELEVEDFHFLGIKLKLQPQDKIQAGQLESFELLYGNRVITKITNPRIIRHEPENCLILTFEGQTGPRAQRGKDRLYVKPSFRPVMMVNDPIKIDTLLNLEVINFSAGGFLLDTSLTNKHLIKDMILEDAIILLPGVKTIKVSFQIKHVNLRVNRVHIGAQITAISEEDMDAIAQFAIFGTLPPNDGQIENKIKSVKANITKVRKLGPAIRCEVLSSIEDYSSVLRVRYAAYKKAEKLKENLNVEDMADEFDERSIILIVKADTAVVGTVRLVTCQNARHNFPFEEYVSYNEHFKGDDKKNFYEVSRLAIDPFFQGADILTKLFKEVARLTIMNEKTTLCLSTKLLRPTYKKIGFRQISKETSHPVLKHESLALMRVESEEFIYGSNMSATAWHLVVKDVVDNLYFAQVIKKRPSLRWKKSKMIIESLYLKLRKKIKSSR